MNKRAILFTLVFAFISLSLFQCEKDEGEKSSDPYMGIWEVISVSGGFSGNGYTPDFNHLTLKDNGTYRLEMNTQLISSGTFNLYEKEQEDWISFSPASTNDQNIFESEDKMIGINTEGNLVMAEPCCDLYQYEFGKVSD